jgi:diaminohydroxyphosphoribosylaminopyrimidine deaminase/5-amino-6-(5-phosphoribosylamino)uracil reductase
LDADGGLLATGYSRESDDTVHAEESALGKLGERDRPHTVYSSMEPCGRRRSRPRTCAELIVEAGVARVVYALGEPPVFVEPTGADLLRRAGVEVVRIADLADEVRKINEHLDG